MPNSNKKKVRFHYYEDPDVYAYIKKRPHWEGSRWVREATRKHFELSTGKGMDTKNE